MLLKTCHVDFTFRLDGTIEYIYCSFGSDYSTFRVQGEQGKKRGRRDEVRKELNPLPMLRHVASMYWIVKRFKRSKCNRLDIQVNILSYVQRSVINIVVNPIFKYKYQD